jgi:hypothetical protein
VAPPTLALPQRPIPATDKVAPIGASPSALAAAPRKQGTLLLVAGLVIAVAAAVILVLLFVVR